MTGIENLNVQMANLAAKLGISKASDEDSSSSSDKLLAGSKSVDLTKVDESLLSKENKVLLDKLKAEVVEINSPPESPIQYSDVKAETPEVVAADETTTLKSAEVVEGATEPKQTEFGSVEELCAYFDVDDSSSVSEAEINAMQAAYPDGTKVTIGGVQYSINTVGGQRTGQAGLNELFIVDADAVNNVKGNSGDQDIMISSVAMNGANQGSGHTGDGNGFTWSVGVGGQYEAGNSMHFDTLQDLQNWVETQGASGEVDGVINTEEITNAINKLDADNVTKISIGTDPENYTYYDYNRETGTGTSNNYDSIKDDRFTTGTKNDLVLAINNESSDYSINTGLGDDVVIAVNVENISTGDGDDAVVASGSTDNITTGDGEDYVKLVEIPRTDLPAADAATVPRDAASNYGQSGGGHTTVNTGNDADTIEIYTDKNTVSAGDGNDTISVFGNENKVTSGDNKSLSLVDKALGKKLAADNDVISVYGDRNNVNAGKGDDTIKLYGDGDSKNKIYGENGNDDFQIYTVSNDNLNGGNDSDDYWVMESAQAELNKMPGNGASEFDRELGDAYNSENSGLGVTMSDADDHGKLAGYAIDGAKGDDRIGIGYTSDLTTTNLGNLTSSSIANSVKVMNNSGIAVPTTVTTQAELTSYLTDFYGTTEFDSLEAGVKNEIRQYLGLPEMNNGKIVTPMLGSGAPCQFIIEGLKTGGPHPTEPAYDANHDGKVTSKEYYDFMIKFVKTSSFTELSPSLQKAINEYLTAKPTTGSILPNVLKNLFK